MIVLEFLVGLLVLGALFGLFTAIGFGINHFLLNEDPENPTMPNLIVGLLSTVMGSMVLLLVWMAGHGLIESLSGK